MLGWACLLCLRELCSSLKARRIHVNNSTLLHLLLGTVTSLSMTLTRVDSRRTNFRVIGLMGK